MRRTTRFLAPSFVLGTTIFFFFPFVCLPFREFLAKQQTHTHTTKIKCTQHSASAAAAAAIGHWKEKWGKMEKTRDACAHHLCTLITFLQFRALFAFMAAAMVWRQLYKLKFFLFCFHLFIHSPPLFEALGWSERRGRGQNRKRASA